MLEKIYTWIYNRTTNFILSTMEHCYTHNLIENWNMSIITAPSNCSVFTRIKKSRIQLSVLWSDEVTVFYSSDIGT